jgi:multidrug transporter EmrE-like cation transporter
LSRSTDPDEIQSVIDVDEQPAAAPSGGNRVSLLSLVLLLFAVGSAAVGQLLLKHGMVTATKKVEQTKGSLAIAAGTSPWVLLGLTVFAVSAVAWLMTLSKVPLSLAYPFNALGYLGILTASVLVLNEKANVWTWVGTLCVVGGLILVVTTKPA